jgi:hypothetical protein
VVLEEPASGPMRIVSIVTKTPLHVSEIENRRPAELSRTALERSLGGVVTEVKVEVQSSR